MVSKKRIKSSEEDKATRSPKGSLNMSLEMVTRLLTLNSLARDNATNIIAMLISEEPIEISPEQKQAVQAKVKSVLEDAAETVSIYRHLDVLYQKRTAENLICLMFIVHMMFKGEPKEHKTKFHKAVMVKVRKQVENHKLVQKALRSYAALPEIEGIYNSDEIKAKYFNKMKDEAVSKWREFRRNRATSQTVKDRLIRTITEEFNL
jgi:hypothetical protein